MIRSKRADGTEHAITYHGPDQIKRRRYRRRAITAGRTSSLSIFGGRNEVHDLDSG
jgi:hypothetical protein